MLSSTVVNIATFVAAQRIVTRDSSRADTSVSRPEQEYFPTRTVEIERKASAAVTTSRSANIMERKRIEESSLVRIACGDFYKFLIDEKIRTVHQWHALRTHRRRGINVNELFSLSLNQFRVGELKYFGKSSRALELLTDDTRNIVQIANCNLNPPTDIESISSQQKEVWQIIRNFNWKFYYEFIMLKARKKATNDDLSTFPSKKKRTPN